MKRDENTYGDVGRKFDEYSENAPAKPASPATPVARGLPAQRPYVPPTEREGGLTVPAIIGMGIGVILLVLAAISYYNAAKWGGRYNRDGAATGYTLVGFFLTIAGLGGLLSTYNHNFRVLPGRAGHGHGH